MVEKIPCIIAVFINFFLRISIFMQPSSECSPCAPHIASVMVMVALCMLILDHSMFPDRYRRAIGPTLLISSEIVFVLVLLEIGMNIIWCQLERILETTLKLAFMADGSNMYADMGGDTFTGFVISALAFAVLVNAAIMTGWMAYLKSHLLIALRSRQLRNVLDYCNGGSCGDVKDTLKKTMSSPEPEHTAEDVLYDSQQCELPEEQESPKPKIPSQPRKIISLRCSIKE